MFSFAGVVPVSAVSICPRDFYVLTLHIAVPSLELFQCAQTGYILEELLNEVNVGEDHAAAAVTLKTDTIECFTRRAACQQKAHIKNPQGACSI